MYYSNGNYEAFARPRKPEGVEHKSAYLAGSGLASLAAACFLVRDGRMPGGQIHILEAGSLPGGSCDACQDPTRGYVMRGGREMDNHFECLWDLFRSIPSLETEGVSVLDEYYWLNQDDPNFSLCRATEDRGRDAHTDGKFTLSDRAALELLKLFMTRDEDLYDKTLDDVFDQEFYRSNFWLYWQTMFAFETWHSALEMKLYLQRFLHHVGGLPDFKALRFTKYNQYESLILPMVKYLKDHGVEFEYNVKVENVEFDLSGEKRVAKRLILNRSGERQAVALTEDDLVFVTNGSCTESSAYGDQTHAPSLAVTNGQGSCWDLWRSIARQDPNHFGHPAKFCMDIGRSNWESATVTTLDGRIPPYLERICKRDPFSGGVVTGGIVTVKDSGWLMSWTVNRQPQFRSQPGDQLVVWVYGLYTDRPGNFVRKPMKECTGEEITQEWLYHLGVPEDQIPDMAATGANCVPVLMPYITAFFMPRGRGDRPLVVPQGCVNFAFLGQFAETPRDTVFTVEYSVRTAMEAVYTLLNVERGVPEVYGSVYDVRCLLDATGKLLDGKGLEDFKLPFAANLVKGKALKAISGTVVEQLLRRYHLL